jgi:exodeoxyribonuclease VII large subunit
MRAVPLSTIGEAALSVSDLTAQIKGLLEGSFPQVWVAGEISNCSRPQSGHWYFSLKDERAQIRAVMWRSTAARLKFELQDGLEVTCRGALDVYPPRGSYQLVVDQVLPKGVGALELALRKLQEKLAAEGLFDASRKRPLPKFPRRIGVVTSPTGAAIRDFLEVLRRRWHGSRVLIIPARVQGDGAAAEITESIRSANRLRPELDVLVLCRGGGSLEDLWAFNEEPVVRAIAASRVPTVTAIGHEIDVTLADLAADVRALTPSEAAERVLPAQADVLVSVGRYRQRLQIAIARRLERAQARWEALAARRPFRRPFDLLRDLDRHLDELSVRGRRAICQQHRLERDRVARLAGKLQTLSPLAVLGRGYSITQKEATGEVIRDAHNVILGERLVSRFLDGRATSRVEEVDSNGKDLVGENGEARG